MCACSFQRALPRLFVPRVSDTIKSFLASVKPLLPADEYTNLSTLAAGFQSTVAGKANLLLWAKSWWSDNYISDWWLKYGACPRCRIVASS